MRYAVLSILLFAGAGFAQEFTWSTYRGNAQRTGNIDRQPGPKTPALRWSMKSEDHFVAAPVPHQQQVIFPALGALNKPSVYGFPTQPADPSKVAPLWVRTAPAIKLPTVSSPAFHSGMMVFGDGMHQTDGSVLYCFPANGGYLIWQFTVPGELVHMEGSPTIANGRVYVGAGSAGVFCVDLNIVELDGKTLSASDIPARQAAQWKTLQAAYEADKKKDPDFAIPPTEDRLLKPTPKVHWQVGKGIWHVDAAINVVGDRVLVASAFLDKEQKGSRMIYCLDASTGREIWKVPTQFNCWSGASVQGNTVIVTTSSISYQAEKTEGAKGEILAIDLATGKEKWKKAVPGGVLGCAALSEDRAIFTASDGKLRVFNIADGSRAAIYDAKAPIFAPPALVGEVAYLGDLQGIVHAVDIKTGAALWTYDLGKEVKLPGMSYGGITVQRGQLYFATCNLEGPFKKQPTGVFCLGAIP